MPRRVRNQRVKKMNIRRILLASCSMFCLSACAVSPQLMTQSERTAAIEANMLEINANQRLPIKNLALSDAVARAILHNHDYRSQQLVSALEKTQIDLSNWSMMPDVLASAGYKYRNPENLTTSSANTINSSLSEEKRRRVADLMFSWNLLDFGMSYYRAQQQADKFLQSRERNRRVRHQIVQDTVTAWYRAEANARLQTRIDPLMVRVRQALDASRASETSRAETPLVALNYQRELLDMLQTLDALKKELSGSEHVLAAIIGVNPGVVVTTGKADLALTRPNLTVAQLENVALHHRPDVQSALYQARITETEARLAVASLIPVPTVQFGPSYDSNTYLVRNSWFGASAQIAQSLMKPFRYGDIKASNEVREKLDREQTLALTAASLLQVNLANVQLNVAQEALKTAEMQLDVAQRINKQVRDATNSQQQPEINLIREDMKLLLTQVRRDLAALEVQSARVKLMTSIGFDLVPDDDELDDPSELAKAMRVEMTKLPQLGKMKTNG